MFAASLRHPTVSVNRWKWAIKRSSNIHIQGDKPNIFIFSTARSGSTWLMEIISSQPQIKFINEPLLMSQFDYPGAPLPASWEFLLPHAERKSKLESYFHQLLANRLGVGSPAPFSRFHRFISRRFVVKDLRCHDLMNWFEKQFNFKIIYLVRHPIPTALSRKEYARLPLFLSNDIYCQRYLTPELRRYGCAIVEHGTDLEKKVLDWCLQNLPPMKFLDRSNWFCVHYEDMVLDPATTIELLANFIGQVDKDKMLRQVKSASSSVFLSDPHTQDFLKQQQAANGDRLYLVNRWRKRISPEEEKQVFEILRKFEMDVYQLGKDLPVHRL
jgi:Sulfotransferase domain